MSNPLILSRELPTAPEAAEVVTPEPQRSPCRHGELATKCSNKRAWWVGKNGRESAPAEATRGAFVTAAADRGRYAGGDEKLLGYRLAGSFRRIDLVIGFTSSANQRTRPVNGTVLTDLVSAEDESKAWMGPRIHSRSGQKGGRGLK